MHLNTLPFTAAEVAYRRERVAADFAATSARRPRTHRLPRRAPRTALRRAAATG